MSLCSKERWSKSPLWMKQGPTTRHKTYCLTLGFSEDNLKRPGWTLVSQQEKMFNTPVRFLCKKYAVCCFMDT